MIRRLVGPHLRALLAKYPAVALLGPRQAGKTTLARTLGRRDYDLELEPERLRLDMQWNEIVKSRSLVVLDEAQAYPDIFPRLRAAIDQDRSRRGRFLLLGSVSPALARQVSESLAGRLALCELTPFLAPERPAAHCDRLWLRGGYPDGGILDPGRFPDWQVHYIELLAQRDLPQWGFPAKPRTTIRFLKMLAACHGAVWNASDIGRSLGLSYHTVNAYLDYLDGAFLVRRLSPFHGNVRKRLTRSPKIYWRDSGLLHALLGVSTPDDLLTRPWVGASWEGFVVEQVHGLLNALGKRFESSFLRTSDGQEIDLVLDLAGGRWAIEIKLTSSPGSRDMGRLDKTALLVRADRRVLVSRAPLTVESGERVSTNLRGLMELLRKA